MFREILVLALLGPGPGRALQENWKDNLLSIWLGDSFLAEVRQEITEFKDEMACYSRQKTATMMERCITNPYFDMLSATKQHASPNQGSMATEQAQEPQLGAVGEGDKESQDDEPTMLQYVVVIVVCFTFPSVLVLMWLAYMNKAKKRRRHEKLTKEMMKMDSSVTKYKCLRSSPSEEAACCSPAVLFVEEEEETQQLDIEMPAPEVHETGTLDAVDEAPKLSPNWVDASDSHANATVLDEGKRPVIAACTGFSRSRMAVSWAAVDKVPELSPNEVDAGDSHVDGGAVDAVSTATTEAPPSRPKKRRCRCLRALAKLFRRKKKRLPDAA